MVNKKDNVNSLFSGKIIYGDDFSQEKINRWFEEEREGYFSLIDPSYYVYERHEINKLHGIQQVENDREI